MRENLPITMRLPEGFLDSEVRSGTQLSPRQKRILAIQLDLVHKFLAVCKAHDIHVVAFAGTLLGAVRHKGFIPWDDDADFCMDRANFEKLRNLPPDAFPAPYFLQTAFSDRKFFCPYARLRNSQTTGVIVGEDYPDYNNGIYIDIFVLDGLSSHPWVVTIQNKLKSLVMVTLALMVRRFNAFGYRFWVKCFDAVISARTKAVDRISLMTHYGFLQNRYWLKKDELYDTVELPFENITVPVPRNYAEVLTRIYRNYMEFPPVTQRGTWHQDMLLFDPDVSYIDFLNNNTSMRKAWFVTFADSRLWNPLRRIRRQAQKIGFARERILTMTEKDLTPAFRKEMAVHLVKGSRGYGYWCWRAQVVLQALRRMQDGEVMLYCDAGCHLNASGLPRLREYLKLVDESEILAFQGRSLLGSDKYDPDHHFNAVGMWTKGDVLDYFRVRNDEELLRSGQYSGGVFLVKKTPRTVAFYEEYLSIVKAHFNFLDDSPSVSPNCLEFIENRHDQAVFTLLCKRHGVKTLSTCEYGLYGVHAPERYKGDRNWSRDSFDDMKEFPVHALRDTPCGLRAFLPRNIRRWGLRILTHLTSSGKD